MTPSPSRKLIPDWPDELTLTPKEVLNIIVDLNARCDGRFEEVVNEMHLAIEELWHTRNKS